METVLGCGYSINDESAVTDFYSPPSSIAADEDDDLFYPEDDEIETLSIEPNNNNNNNNNDTTYSSLSVDEINETNLKDELKPLPLKLMSLETTPPPTPVPRRLLDPINTTIIDFQNMKINTNLPVVPSKITDITNTNWSLDATLFSGVTNKVPTNLLTPTSMDRYLIEQRRLSDSIYKSSTTLGSTTNGHQSISVQHTEVTNETSRLYSYMTPMDGLSPNLRTAACAASSCNSWSTFDDTSSQIPVHNNSYTPQMNMKSPSYLNNSLFPRPVNPMFPNTNGQFNQSPSFQDPWFLSEMSSMLHQNNNNNNNNNISLSKTAQQILNGNNRPLRSEKIDIDVIKQLIQEANWKRQCGMKKEICVFCRNNGENELIYSSHSLKDSMGNVTCPILRAYHCPICGATGSQAHTIKYCQATGDDNNRHVLTPYEKILRMQTFGFDDNMTSSIPSFFGQLGSPTSLYTNGWSDSYL